MGAVCSGVSFQLPSRSFQKASLHLFRDMWRSGKKRVLMNMMHLMRVISHHFPQVRDVSTSPDCHHFDARCCLPYKQTLHVTFTITMYDPNPHTVLCTIFFSFFNLLRRGVNRCHSHHMFSLFIKY